MEVPRDRGEYVYSPYGGAEFTRGDANFDGRIELTDAVFTLCYLFLGAPAPACLDAADGDDSGAIVITDAVRILGYLFLGDDPPPPPFPARGVDPTEDGIDCRGF